MLVTGCILDQVFQPYECHIDYIFQFLLDNHLYGMNFIYLSNAIFRFPLPIYNKDIDIKSPLNERIYSVESVPLDLIKKYTPYKNKKINPNVKYIDPIYYGTGLYMRQTSILII